MLEIPNSNLGCLLLLFVVVVVVCLLLLLLFVCLFVVVCCYFCLFVCFSGRSAKISNTVHFSSRSHVRHSKYLFGSNPSNFVFQNDAGLRFTYVKAFCLLLVKIVKKTNETKPCVLTSIVHAVLCDHSIKTSRSTHIYI